MVNSDRLRELLLDEDSDAARRFYGMGFTLGRLDLHEDVDYIRVRATFTCICGRTEQLSQMVSMDMLKHAPDIAAKEFNVYRALDRIGSMSRKHLLEDGYTPEQVDDMERRYQESQKT